MERSVDERRELTLDKAKQRCNSFGMTIYTPYSNSEANQLLKWFRGKNAWLGSTTKLVFWTNLERADDETANIVAPNDVIQKKHFQKYIEKNSICFRNNDSSSDGTGVAGASECNDDDDATRHHFMCVERIEAGYKQQRKVVINYEHNAKEVFMLFGFATIPYSIRQMKAGVNGRYLKKYLDQNTIRFRLATLA